jgi:putative ABC transport system permease protein
MWGFSSFEWIAQDLRYAVRGLRRSPGFTALACAAFALGIGATTAVFSVVRSVLLRPLPYPEPAALVAIWERPPRSDHRNVVAMSNFLAWRERARSFEAMAAFTERPMNLIGPEEPVQVTGAEVSPDLFRALGVPPALGRTLLRGEDAPGSAPVVVLSHAFWQRRFGGRADAIGQKVSVDATHHEVVGVMPPGFAFPNPRVEIFVPLPAVPSNGRNYSIVARLRTGTTPAEAQAEMNVLAAQTAAESPAVNADWSATVVPLHEQTVGAVGPALWLLFAAVSFLHLIACANVANLLLMRSASRAREMGVRAALGAGGWRLLHQVMVESLVLAAAGGLLGVALAYAGVRALVALLPASFPLPRLQEIGVDPAVLAFATVAVVVPGLLFSVAPAVYARRTDVAQALRASGRGVAGSHGRFRAALVVAEVALALPLLAGAGLMARSFLRLDRVPPGFRPEGVLTVRMMLLPVGDRAMRAEVVERVLERVRALPEVAAAASIGILPMGGTNSGSWYYRADRPEPDPAARPGGDVSIVTPGYFRTLGIPLLAGRDFDERDRRGGPHVGIVNEAAARFFFQGESALGRTLKVWWGDAGLVEIVGIVADIRHAEVKSPPEPCLFMPNAQQPYPFASLVVRTRGEPRAVAAAIKDEIRRVDGDQGVAEVQTMEERVRDSISRPRAEAVLFGVFGFLAVALAAVGIYGVLAYSVTQRRREMGIRLALGSSVGGAFRLVLREGLLLCMAGMALGLVAAAALTRQLQSLLFEVEPLDVPTFAAVGVVLCLVATAACLVPATRAARTAPAIVLREE